MLYLSLQTSLERKQFAMTTAHATPVIMWHDGSKTRFTRMPAGEADALQTALARIVELEAELAKRPKARAARKAATEPCQACGDTKTEKITFLGLPMCGGVNFEWKLCASRIRRNRDSGKYVAYNFDKRYKTSKSGDGRWAVRFNGEVIAIHTTQAEVRRLAFDQWLAAKAEEAAA